MTEHNKMGCGVFVCIHCRCMWLFYEVASLVNIIKPSCLLLTKVVILSNCGIGIVKMAAILLNRVPHDNFLLPFKNTASKHQKTIKIDIFYEVLTVCLFYASGDTPMCAFTGQPCWFISVNCFGWHCGKRIGESGHILVISTATIVKMNR